MPDLFLQYGALWWRFLIWSRLFYYRRVCNSAEQKISQNIIQNYTKCRKIFQDEQIFLTILVEFAVRITYMVAVYERKLVYSPSIILS